MAETVNYAIQRGDLFCTVGCIGALVVYAVYPERRRFGLYLLPLSFALLSKPPAAVFTFLLFFYVFFFEAAAGTGRLRKSLTAILPSTAVVAVLMVLQSVMTPHTFMPSIIPPWDYRLTQPFVWARYAAELFLPIHLNVDSDLGAFERLNAFAALGLCFLLALCIAIAFCARRRTLYPIAYGLIWFVVTQLPTSLYPLSEVENDHRMFFSFPGLILAVVWAAKLTWDGWLGATIRQRARPWAAGCLVLALGGYAWGVHVRNQVWRTEDSLWLDDVEKSPHNGRGLMIYGLTLMNKGAYPEALAYFTQALRYTPNYSTLEVNLGVVNGAMNRNAEAQQHFARAIALTPNDDQAHAFYGRWLAQTGRTQEAVDQMKLAITLNPARPFAHEELLAVYSQSGQSAALHAAALETLQAVPGDAVATEMLTHPPSSTAAALINTSLDQYRQGKYQESIQSAQNALQLDPKSAEAYNNIGAAYGAMQQWNQGIENEQAALRLQPDLQIARNNLALFAQKKTAAPAAMTATAADLINRSLALNQAGQYQESISAAQEALRIDPSSAEAWNNIAAGYESLHQWDEAIAAAQKALALKPDFQLARNNLAWSLQQRQATSAH